MVVQSGIGLSPAAVVDGQNPSLVPDSWEEAGVRSSPSRS